MVRPCGSGSAEIKMSWYPHTCETEWHGTHPLGGIQTPPPVERGPCKSGEVRLLTPYVPATQENILAMLTKHGALRLHNLAYRMSCKPCNVKERLRTLIGRNRVIDNDGEYSINAENTTEDAIPKRVLLWLKDHPDSIGLAVALNLGLPAYSVSSALSRLVKQKQIVGVKRGGCSQYSVVL